MDALADAGGQQVLSLYHAMACNPALMVDPLGLRSSVFDNGASHPNPPVDPLAYAKAMFPTMHMYVPGGDLFNAGNMARNLGMAQTQAVMEVLNTLSKLSQALGWAAEESASGSKASGNAGETAVENGNKKSDQSNSETTEIIKYRHPTFGTEKEVQAVEAAGLQKYGETNCNTRNLRFIATLLSIDGIDWQKIIDLNQSIQDNGRDMEKMLVEAKVDYKSMMSTPTIRATGEAIENGGVVYMISYFDVGGGRFTGHRVSLVGIDYNPSDPKKSGAYLYESFDKKIVYRPNFFNGNEAHGNGIMTRLHIRNSYVIFKPK